MKYRIVVPKNKNQQKRNSGKVTRVIVVDDLYKTVDAMPTVPVFVTKRAARLGSKQVFIPRYNTKTLAQRKAMIKRVSDVYSSIYNNEGQELMNAINVLKKRNVTV